MNRRKPERIIRPATTDERTRHAQIREQVIQEFPPADEAGRKASPPGIPSEIRRAREAKGLTWSAVAHLAGIASSNTVRDIEYGRDAKLSEVQSIAKVLGLRLELLQVTDLAK